MRLIDTGSLKYRRKDYSGYDDVGDEERKRGILFLLKEDIEAAPTIDSIKHGKWVLKKELVPLPWDWDPLDWDNYDESTHSEWEEFYHCSNCDYKTGTFERTNYCPNCGAQMENPEVYILNEDECDG